MNKQLRFIAALSLIFLFLNLSCQRDVEGSLPTSTNPPPATSEKVSATVIGRVLDEKEIPVSGALAKTETAAATTNVNGEFRLENVMLDKKTGFIKVEKAGYFVGSRSFVVNTASENITEIKLIPKKEAGSFVASSGGSVTVPNGGTISFSPNAVVNTITNSTYSGNVSVAAFYLNPTAEDFNEIMPGSLRGTSADNAEVGLQSFGMMAVELSGANGEKLQLAAGKTASINFPIPTSLLSSAPQSIPLWYFDESKGLWKEEGSATKQGSNYVGNVSHFSFWNCDAPYNLVDFEVSFKNQNGAPITAARVELSFVSNKNMVSGSGITNATGGVMGKVPANTQLQMDVINNCGVKIYSKEITTTTSNLNLGTLTINVPASADISISGTVSGCNATPVTNGFVHIAIAGKYYRAPVTNGSFSTSATVCSAGTYIVTLLAFDRANNKQSDSVKIVVNTNAATAPVGLTVCEMSIEQFINYTVNGQSYSLVPPADSVVYSSQSTYDFLYAVSRTNSSKVSMAFQKVTSVGSVALNNIGVSLRDSSFTGQNISTLNITEYNPTANGTYIAGSLTGNVQYDSAGTKSYPVNLSFRVKK